MWHNTQQSGNMSVLDWDSNAMVSKCSSWQLRAMKRVYLTGTLNELEAEGQVEQRTLTGHFSPNFFSTTINVFRIRTIFIVLKYTLT